MNLRTVRGSQSLEVLPNLALAQKPRRIRSFPDDLREVGTALHGGGSGAVFRIAAELVEQQ